MVAAALGQVVFEASAATPFTLKDTHFQPFAGSELIAGQLVNRAETINNNNLRFRAPGSCTLMGIRNLLCYGAAHSACASCVTHLTVVARDASSAQAKTHLAAMWVPERRLSCAVLRARTTLTATLGRGISRVTSTAI